MNLIMNVIMNVTRLYNEDFGVKIAPDV